MTARELAALTTEDLNAPGYVFPGYPHWFLDAAERERTRRDRLAAERADFFLLFIPFVGFGTLAFWLAVVSAYGVWRDFAALNATGPVLWFWSSGFTWLGAFLLLGSICHGGALWAWSIYRERVTGACP